MQLSKLINYVFGTLLLLILLAFKIPESEINEQRAEVVVRRIGNEFLLQLGDSTSRILPIKKQDGRYLLQFENEFAFEPDLLSFSVIKVFEEASVKNNFIVETKNCITNEVVHSFEITDTTNNSEIACRKRGLPKACYNIYVTIIEENTPKTVIPKTIKQDNSTLIYLTLFGVVLLLIVLVIVKRKKKNSSQIEFIKIGAFLFDKNAMKLIYKDKKEELSNKEASLLDLLYTNVNETVKREEILQVVWEDEGDYLGRTLDVFISKLRKKLEADSNIEIRNIRGVGYRLVIN